MGISLAVGRLTLDQVAEVRILHPQPMRNAYCHWRATQSASRKGAGINCMTSLLFDTHKAVKELQEAGFDEAQAEAVVATVGTAIIGNVATKQDVDALGSELRSEIQATNREVSGLRSEIQTNVATKQEVSDVRSDLRSGMQAMELRITLRMGGLIAAGIGLMIALDKLL